MPIGRNHRDGWHEQYPHPKTRAQALGEEDLPVLRRKAGHKGAEDNHGRPEKSRVLCIARIGGAAGQRPHEERQEHLNGAYPGHLRLGQR